jgi:hypothetical protein
MNNVNNVNNMNNMNNMNSFEHGPLKGPEYTQT